MKKFAIFPVTSTPLEKLALCSHFHSFLRFNLPIHFKEFNWNTNSACRSNRVGFFVWFFVLSLFFCFVGNCLFEVGRYTKPAEVSTSSRCFASFPFYLIHTFKKLPNEAGLSPLSANSSFCFDFSGFLGLFLWATFDWKQYSRIRGGLFRLSWRRGPLSFFEDKMLLKRASISSHSLFFNDLMRDWFLHFQ